MKNTSTEMKNAFYGLISRLDTAEEGVTELEYILSEASKSEKHRIKTEKKKWKRISKDCGTTTKGIKYAKWEHQKKKKYGKEHKKYLKQ